MVAAVGVAEKTTVATARLAVAAAVSKTLNILLLLNHHRQPRLRYIRCNRSMRRFKGSNSSITNRLEAVPVSVPAPVSTPSRRLLLPLLIITVMSTTSPMPRG
jgi:hypothetical protein